MSSPDALQITHDTNYNNYKQSRHDLNNARIKSYLEKLRTRDQIDEWARLQQQQLLIVRDGNEKQKVDMKQTEEQFAILMRNFKARCEVLDALVSSWKEDVEYSRKILEGGARIVGSGVDQHGP